MTVAAAVEEVEDDRDQDGPVAESSCYLPWCQECHAPHTVAVALGDYGHHHVGTIGEVVIADAPAAEIRAVTVALDRYDDDADGDPDGPTTICLTVGGNAYLSPSEARRVAELLLDAVQVHQRSAHLANPNRVAGAS